MSIDRGLSVSTDSTVAIILTVAERCKWRTLQIIKNRDQTVMSIIVSHIVGKAASEVKL